MNKDIEIVEKAYEESKERERKFRNTQLVLCILIALVAIPLFKIHFFFSGVMVIIIGVVLYIKIRQISFDRLKSWEHILEVLKSKKNESKS